MKIWTSEHTFNHPWEMVTQAAWRKYPNPLNTSVVAIDIVDRKIEEGKLHSHRLLTTRWGVPRWAQTLFGADKMGYASEHSVVDPEQKVMTMMSRNLNFTKELVLVEKLTYTEHPTEPGCTLMTQEAVVTIKGVPLSSHLESFIAGSISSNATKGRQAMELVIGKIKDEMADLKNSVDDIANHVEGVAREAKHVASRVEDLVTVRAEGVAREAKHVASRVEDLVTVRAEEAVPAPRGWFQWFRG